VQEAPGRRRRNMKVRRIPSPRRKRRKTTVKRGMRNGRQTDECGFLASMNYYRYEILIE
jgi:hypothetical protein